VIATSRRSARRSEIGKTCNVENCDTALVATIKAHLAKGDQHYISAGLHLKELTARKPSEAPWPEYVPRLLISGSPAPTN
jgi:hypothetical protein